MQQCAFTISRPGQRKLEGPSVYCTKNYPYCISTKQQSNHPKTNCSNTKILCQHINFQHASCTFWHNKHKTVYQILSHTVTMSIFNFSYNEINLPDHFSFQRFQSDRIQLNYFHKIGVNSFHTIDSDSLNIVSKEYVTGKHNPMLFSPFCDFKVHNLFI